MADDRSVGHAGMPSAACWIGRSPWSARYRLTGKLTGNSSAFLHARSDVERLTRRRADSQHPPARSGTLAEANLKIAIGASQSWVHPSPSAKFVFKVASFGHVARAKQRAPDWQFRILSPISRRHT